LREGDCVHARAYLTPDGDVLHVSRFNEPFVVRSNFTVEVPAGKARFPFW
jgi:hypothetical protein